nr:alpha amylase C-terminal domain-containing protein [Pseudomonas fluorescens]
MTASIRVSCPSQCITVNAVDTVRNTSFHQRIRSVASQEKGGTIGADGGELHADTHEANRIGVPFAGQWSEVLNSDSSIYARFYYGNSGGVTVK